jgi:hypothetical protein
MLVWTQFTELCRIQSTRMTLIWRMGGQSIILQGLRRATVALEGFWVVVGCRSFSAFTKELSHFSHLCNFKVSIYKKHVNWCLLCHILCVLYIGAVTNAIQHCWSAVNSNGSPSSANNIGTTYHAFFIHNCCFTLNKVLLSYKRWHLA